MKECFISYNVGFAVPRNSIYEDRFNSVIKKLVETGHVAKWITDEMDNAARASQAKKAETSAEPLSLHHLQAPMFFLPMTHLVAMLVFIVEVSSHLRKQSPTVKIMIVGSDSEDATERREPKIRS